MGKMTDELTLVRQLLEKDIHYIKEKIDHVDAHLEKLNSQVAKNTEFTERIKWTGTLIVGTATLIAGTASFLGSMAAKYWK